MRTGPQPTAALRAFRNPRTGHLLRATDHSEEQPMERSRGTRSSAILALAAMAAIVVTAAAAGKGPHPQSHAAKAAQHAAKHAQHAAKHAGKGTGHAAKPGKPDKPDKSAKL